MTHGLNQNVLLGTVEGDDGRFQIFHVDRDGEDHILFEIKEGGALTEVVLPFKDAGDMLATALGSMVVYKTGKSPEANLAELLNSHG